MIETEPMVQRGKFHILKEDGPGFPRLGFVDRKFTPIDINLPNNTPLDWSLSLYNHIKDYRYTTDIFHNVEIFHFSGIAADVHRYANALLLQKPLRRGEKVPDNFDKLALVAQKRLSLLAKNIALQKFQGEAAKMVMESDDPLNPEFVAQTQKPQEQGKELYSHEKQLTEECVTRGITGEEQRAIKQAYHTIVDLSTTYLSLLVGDDYLNNKFFSGRPDVFLTLMTYVDMALQYDLGERQRLFNNDWSPVGRIIYALEQAETFPSGNLGSRDIAEIMSTYSQLLSTVEDRYFSHMLESFLLNANDKKRAKTMFPDNLPLIKLGYIKPFFLDHFDGQTVHEARVLGMLKHYKLDRLANKLDSLFENNKVSIEMSAKSTLRSRLETGKSIQDQLKQNCIDPNQIPESDMMHELTKHIVINQPETVLTPSVYFALPEMFRARFYVAASEFNPIVKILSEENDKDKNVEYKSGDEWPPVHFLETQHNQAPKITAIGIHHPYTGNAAQRIVEALFNERFAMVRTIFELGGIQLYGTTDTGYVEIQWFPHAIGYKMTVKGSQLVSIQRKIHAQRRKYITQRNTKEFK
ncbi:MAG: hypothetical protein Q7R95_09545 [bacterium]|nr:hypothetical protein [bacterium]